MENNFQKQITYGTQVIFETVYQGQQGVGIIENGVYRFVPCSLTQFVLYNEKHYATNLAIAKRLAKDILGTSHAAPYFFMDMVWVPVENHNRSVILYVALHHFERIANVTQNGTVMELRHGARLHLGITKHVLTMRLFVALLLKGLLDMKKQTLYEAPKLPLKRCEVVKEAGNVYYTVKKDEEDNE